MRVLVLIRGINVGGVVLPMDTLKAILTALGFENCKTYIQSGNVVFDTTEKNLSTIEFLIEEALFRQMNRKIDIFVFDKEQFVKSVTANPYTCEVDQKSMYLTFLKAHPEQDVNVLLKTLESDRELFSYDDGVIFGCYGSGYGRSKFNNNYFEKKLGVSATTRNLATVQKLVQLLEG